MFSVMNEKIGSLKHIAGWLFVLIVMVAITVGGTEQTEQAVEVNEIASAHDVNSGIENQDVNVEMQAAEIETIPAVVEQNTIEDVLKEAEVMPDGTIQSITFKKDMAIRDALTFLSLKYNKNIVVSPKVDGQLAFTSLFNVTFEEAMDSILGDNFEYETQGSVVKVYKKDDINRMTFKVFQLYYISAADARKMVGPVMSKDGKIEATSAAKTGVPVGDSINADTAAGDTMANKDAIIVYDYPENIADVGAILKSVDARPKQVLIEATILSATLTEDMQFGIDWNTIRGVTPALNSTQNSALFEGSAQASITGGIRIGVSINDMTAFIKAVEKVTDVTILANPKILAVNKQLGQVYIGKKIGYRDNQQSTSGGVVSEGEVKFLDTGTKLSFRPYIGEDGYIRMDIHPKDSSGNLVAGIPDETSAELVSNIIVKDGQTIVIGGLFRDKVTSSKTQIPILGDLPFVGIAFRGTADQKERQEVMVLLTPHIIVEPDETEGDARAEDIKRMRIGAKDEMQWMGRVRLAEDRYAKAAKYYLEGDYVKARKELECVLTLQPTYLEALRLRDKIIAETNPAQAAMQERNVLNQIDEKNSVMWIER